MLVFILVSGFYFLGRLSKPSNEITAKIRTQVDIPDGFSRAVAPRNFNFPEDFGPHPQYQTEWWYYTGNLKTEEGRHFGYQLTFFRRGLLPPEQVLTRESDWAASDVYMAHFALSDSMIEIHSAYEKFARGISPLAGATSKPFNVWLENWYVEQINESDFKLYVKADDFELSLLMSDLKGPVLHGNNGLSQKGPTPGSASYYFSQTRLDTMGILALAGNPFAVEGYSWMDHEFSTRALSDGQVGWDWFSIQLDNGYDVMVFQIRRDDGSVDPFSSGTVVSPEGRINHLDDGDFSITVLDTWTSTNSGAEYPVHWDLRIPKINMKIILKPFYPDQELNLSYEYWEGAVEIYGEFNGNNIHGFGYVEMTGYSESFEGEF